ncbi:glycoside hydrolase family 79 protein [Stipitochalara longipes BDJ]|nr:glycoside hydrolase family 79 protein [Stipitochalara longipes BDJ]
MHILNLQLLAISSLIYSLCQTSTATTPTSTIAPTQIQSNGSAIPISRRIGALSIEFCYILDYLGDAGSPNTFSRQLLQNIEDRLGTPPIIRIGGHTQDVARYCENCTSTLANVFVPGNAEAVSVTFGKDLFKVMNDNVPSKQQFIFGLNLGQDEVEFPLAEVVAAEKYLKSERFRSFELGNEPDFYNIQRPDGWNVQVYAQQVLGALAQEPIYMGNFSLVELGEMGVVATMGIVTSLSDHTYPFSICDSTRAALVSLPNLMNHINTIQYFSQWTTEIAAAKSQSISFVMGETGSVSCHGKEGVSNSLGAALWSIDYMLHGAVLGMDSVYFHAGTPFYYSMWQPVVYNNTPAIVWPT